MSVSFLAAASDRALHVGTKTNTTSPPAEVAHANIAQQLSALIDAEVSRAWRCEVVQSTQAGAGDGVFLHGTCAAGSVVAVYPGVAYATEDLPAMHKMVLTGNEYVMFRRDGILIDGRPDGPSAQLWEVAERRERVAGAAPLQRHGELAIGHKINHPPKGTLPNVYVQPFDLRPHEHTELHAHLPVVNFRPPTEGEPSKRAVVLLAARAICDEELWLDYKLRTDGPLEPWYAPVVGSSAATRR